MASYYMDGYAPPQGVNSASKVKEYQRRLGVKADGIWGPDTDSAYRASIQQDTGKSTGGFTWGDSSRDTVFDSYYNAIKSSLTQPVVTVKTPDREEVSSMWSSILRPGTDAAIEKRNRAAEEDMAELDADAVSRGMGGSSFVTSVKARELEEAQEDIGELEAQYGATLAERIYDTLSQYDQMNLTAQKYNAEAAASAAKTALSMASDWYSQYLTRQSAEEMSKSSSSSSKSSSGSSRKSSLSTADYTEYVRNLTKSQQKLLFNSSTEYWSSRRDEIYSALGSTLYENLKKQYGGK